MGNRKGSGPGTRALVWAPFLGAVLIVAGWAALKGGGPTPAQAQAPGAMGQGQGRGFGGFQGRMPFVFGTIASGDVNAGIIVLNSPMGGEQTIRVNASTRYYTQATIAVSALRVGDRVSVQGMPTAITANSITAGEMPNMMPGAPGAGPGAAPGGGPAQAGAQGANRQQARAAFAGATGTVTATSPLTIRIGDNVSLVVRLAPNATVSRISETRLANLRVGDRIMASGQSEDGGDFVATVVGANLQMGPGMGGMGPGMGGRGRGGFGGGPGGSPGGPDAPDGPPGPPPGAPE